MSLYSVNPLRVMTNEYLNQCLARLIEMASLKELICGNSLASED